MMDVRLIAACTGATLAAAQPYAGYLADAMASYRIDAAPMRTVMFLANVGHESTRLTRTAENLNYRVEALLATFSRNRISSAAAQAYGRDGARPANQEAIANLIYGGDWGAKNLGNDRPGDGWLFRGRGLFQSTGRANARRLTARLRARFPALVVPDFEAAPEALSQPQWAALSAADFWDGKGLNDFADQGDFDGVCDCINLGGMTTKHGDAIGWEDRLALLDGGKAAVGIT